MLSAKLDATWRVELMPSRLNRSLGAWLSVGLILGGCGGSGESGFGLNGNAGAAEVNHAGLAAAYLSGRMALDAGNLDDATTEFERAIQADPDNQELRSQLFVLHMSEGSFEDALDVARTLAEFDSPPNDALLLLAFEAYRSQDLDKTEALFEQVSDQGINALVMPFMRAWLKFAQGDTSTAFATLDEDAGSTGLTVVRDYHRASMLQLDGQLSEAVALLREIVPDEEPVPTRLMLQRVAAEQASEQLGQATAFLDSQSQIDGGNVIRETTQAQLEDGAAIPRPIASAEDGFADALMSLARALADQRGGEQALIMGQLAYYVAPRMADISIFIGELLLQNSQFELSLAAFERVADDPIFNYEAQILQATVLRQMERYDDASSMLERLAEQRPERTDALISLGNMHSGNRDYDKAELALSRAVERIGEPRNHDWRLFYSRGIAYERTERWPLAEADFQKSLELFPDQPFVLNYLGYSWVDQELNLDEAKRMLRRAVELRPEDGFIVDSLGWAHFQLGEYDEAVMHLERAVELQPGDPVINDHLGDAYWRVGRVREARYQWERAKLFEPEEDVLASIQEKLRDGLGAEGEPG